MKLLCKFAVGLVAIGIGTAVCAQDLTGTLKKAKDTGAFTIGFRESSIPFSYRSARGEPIGYSIDLCKLLVDAIGEAVGREITIKWQPVTSESRIPAVVGGEPSRLMSTSLAASAVKTAPPEVI